MKCDLQLKPTVMWRIHMWDMTYFFKCVTWLVTHTLQVIYDTEGSTRDWFMCVMWLIHMCAITHFICVPWLIHMCSMTHVCDTTHPYVWHDSFIYVPWLIYTHVVTHLGQMVDDKMGGTWGWFMYVTWLIYTCDMTHSWQVVHDKRVVHGDLKPANFLMVNKELKLIDFGIAKQIEVGFKYVTWLIHICDINPLYVRHKPFICVAYFDGD